MNAENPKTAAAASNQIGTTVSRIISNVDAEYETSTPHANGVTTAMARHQRARLLLGLLEWGARLCATII